MIPPNSMCESTGCDISCRSATFETRPLDLELFGLTLWRY